MFDTLPNSATTFMTWDWPQIEPYVNALLAEELTDAGITEWLKNWTKLAELLGESETRVQLATAVDTTDEAAKEKFNNYLENIFPKVKAANQALSQKLIDSGLKPDIFDIPWRNIQAQIELFREENLPLMTQIQKLTLEYDEIIGAQTVEWNGEDITLSQLEPIYRETDRRRREKAWRLAYQRRLQDREALNELWGKLLDIRQQVAHNAGFDNYRDYQWRRMLRFDYTPADCQTFHEAIEAVVVPVAERLLEKRKKRLGLSALRPWDTKVDPLDRTPLRPFSDTEELVNKCEHIFNRVDPQLGAYFSTMRQQNLLDLDNRKGKAPGGFCTDLAVERVPFIFMNAVGIHNDVQTLLHEGGHAFHVFETQKWLYRQQLDVPMEFAEVASMAMELLAGPYLSEEHGGFYSEADAARARVEHLETDIMFWPYMAVVDAFQHWVYQNVEDAADPDNCDAKWVELWHRFMKGVDWSGLDDALAIGWQVKLHIFQVPFYYIEYGLAQQGAVQVWRNSLDDQQSAIQAYRRALSLGGTVSLPKLYETAGAKFAFDVDTLRQVVDLMEETIEALDPK